MAKIRRGLIGILCKFRLLQGKIKGFGPVIPSFMNTLSGALRRFSVKYLSGDKVCPHQFFPVPCREFILDILWPYFQPYLFPMVPLV
jgi:hypothetical protein